MGIPATMRALQQTSLTGPQDMRLITDAPVPSPDRSEVVIRVAAAGVNFADISQAYGTFPGGPQPPYLAGFEAAGEVVAVGGAVGGPRPGTRVIGVGYGAFAEYMVLPAAAAIPVPADWTPEQALGLVVNWPTALAALKPLGHITGGETVLIHAAAGATGQAAVIMAKHYGATVIATASPNKHETVLALGADHVLDSRDGDLVADVLRLTGGAGADVVLESAGGATFKAGLGAAKPVTGRVIVYGVAGGEAAITNWELVYEHQVHIIGLNIGVLMQATPRSSASSRASCPPSSRTVSSPPLAPPPTTWRRARKPSQNWKPGRPSANSPYGPDHPATRPGRRGRRSRQRAAHGNQTAPAMEAIVEWYRWTVPAQPTLAA